MSDIRISEIKQKACNDLSGKWGNAVLATLVYFLAALGSSLVPLGTIFLAGPLSVGYVLYFMSLIKREQVSVGLVFHSFQFYGNALLTYLLKMIIVMLAGLPVIFYVVYFVYFYSDTLDYISTGRLIGFSTTTLILLILPIYFSLRLGLMYFIVADNPTVPADKALEISWKMMKGNEWDLLLLTLSFILWYLLSTITLGIGFLWLMPYYYTSVGHFYLELKGRYPAYAKMIDNFGMEENNVSGDANSIYVNQ